MESYSVPARMSLECLATLSRISKCDAYQIDDPGVMTVVWDGFLWAPLQEWEIHSPVLCHADERV